MPSDQTGPVGPDPHAFLAHTLATLAYRAAKAVAGADPSFGDYRPAPGSRSAGEILAHMGDLMDWAASQVRMEERWEPRPPTSWDADVERFFDGLQTLDRELAALEREGGGGRQTAWSAERIFQGPIADALTHVGQLTMMRRLAGSPVRGENYSRADIVAGRLGRQQAAPRREFD